MDRQQILNLYAWAPGTCFRHPYKGTVDTTVVKRIRTRSGGPVSVRACRDCILEMEDAQRRAAEEEGSGYEPGHVGDELG